MLLIDANIFLEAELGQQRAEECTSFLKLVQQGSVEALVTDFTVDSIALTIESHKKSARDVRTFLVSLTAYAGLRIYRVTAEEKILATKTMEALRTDFEDSLQLQAMLSNNITDIVSFDRDFDRVPCCQPAVAGKAGRGEPNEGAGAG